MILNKKIILLHLFFINQQFKTIIMAVKPEVIKARLKALFPKANLSQKRLDAIAAKLAPMPADDADDAAVDAVVNQANDFNSFDEIAREDDRVRTLEEKAGKPTPPTPPAPTDPPTPPTPPADVPEWAKGLVEANKALLEKVTAIESGNVLQTKKQTALQSFEKSDVLKGLKPELKDRWVSRVDVNSETPIEDQIKELESEYADLVQVNADNNQYGGPAGTGNLGSTFDEKAMAEVVKSM
jgi:hypothetical protein